MKAWERAIAALLVLSVSITLAVWLYLYRASAVYINRYKVPKTLVKTVDGTPRFVHRQVHPVHHFAEQPWWSVPLAIAVLLLGILLIRLILPLRGSHRSHIALPGSSGGTAALCVLAVLAGFVVEGVFGGAAVIAVLMSVALASRLRRRSRTS